MGTWLKRNLSANLSRDAPIPPRQPGALADLLDLAEKFMTNFLLDPTADQEREKKKASGESSRLLAAAKLIALKLPSDPCAYEQKRIQMLELLFAHSDRFSHSHSFIEYNRDISGINSRRRHDPPFRKSLMLQYFLPGISCSYLSSALSLLRYCIKPPSLSCSSFLQYSASLKSQIAVFDFLKLLFREST